MMADEVETRRRNRILGDGEGGTFLEEERGKSGGSGGWLIENERDSMEGETLAMEENYLTTRVISHI